MYVVCTCFLVPVEAIRYEKQLLYMKKNIYYIYIYRIIKIPASWLAGRTSDNWLVMTIDMLFFSLLLISCSLLVDNDSYYLL